MGWIARLLHPRRGETAGQADARAALARAREARADLARSAPESAALAGQLREMREANHFAEMFREALGGGGAR